MNILVTGGAGFIGAHLLRSLLIGPVPAGIGVVALDDLSGGFRQNIPEDPRVTFVRGSIVDQKLVNELFRKYQFRFIYHLAAYAAEGLSHFIRRFNYTNNLIGSVNLINAAVNYRCECFVFTSSIAVYGPGQVPMVEDMTPQPEDPYGISKYAVELELKSAHEMFGLDYIIFRPHNVYGEYQNIGDRYRNVVGIFMNQILQGKSISIFGDGQQQRAFSYIRDIAPNIARAPLLPAARNRVFNVGNDHPCTVNELAQKVGRVMEINPRIEYLPARKEVSLAYSDHSSAREVFGSTRETPLEEGLAKMLAWVRTVGARKSKPFQNIEILRNLPSAWVDSSE